MAAKYREARVFGFSMMDCINALGSPQFQLQHNFTYDSDGATPAGYFFKFRHGVSFSSWGEDITVEMTALPDGTVGVDVLSVCHLPTQLVDWGKNKHNVKAIFEYLGMMSVQMRQPQMQEQPMYTMEPPMAQPQVQAQPMQTMEPPMAQPQMQEQPMYTMEPPMAQPQVQAQPMQTMEPPMAQPQVQAQPMQTMEPPMAQPQVQAQPMQTMEPPMAQPQVQAQPMQTMELPMAQPQVQAQPMQTMEPPMAQPQMQGQSPAEPQQNFDLCNVCHVCGMILAPDIVFCTQCGTKVVIFEDVVCQSCGAASPAGTKFCTKCGNKF